MATKTFYLTDTDVNGYGELSESAPSSATSNPNAGWTVAKLASGNYSAFIPRTERASGTFGTTVLPAAASLSSSAGGFRSSSQINGSFASANWTLTFEITAVGVGGSQDGNFGIRLYRSANADGSSATEITSARQETNVVTNLATSATTELALTFNPGAITLTNEYLFVQLAWEITGAGGNNSCDVILRIGANETRIVTSDFTPGAQTMNPSPATATASAVTGTLSAENSVTAGPGTATASAVTPTLSATNTLSASPATATATAVTPALNNEETGQNMNPAPATASATAVTPTLSPGAVSLAPAPATATASAGTPTLSPGAVSIAPAPAAATAVAVTPTLSAGSVSLTPAPATAITTAITPTLTEGSFLTPAPATATATAVTPALSPGSVTITALPAVASASAVTCTLDNAGLEPPEQPPSSLMNSRIGHVNFWGRALGTRFPRRG